MPPLHRHILDMRVDATSYAEATDTIIGWAVEGAARYVCAANVHMTMEANDDPSFMQVVNGAAMVVPDGMPLVWGLRLLGVSGASRVYGPDLTLHVCRAAARKRIPIALYGGTEASLRDFCEEMQRLAPGIDICCAIAPPFRKPTAQEDETYAAQIRESGARIVLAGIGCPKQERWMAEHVDQLDAVLIGVGAAFDQYSGRVRTAPRILKSAGLEWAFRLAVEPRRLWKRYAKHNPRFVLRFGRQLLHEHRPASL